MLPEGPRRNIGTDGIRAADTEGQPTQTSNTDSTPRNPRRKLTLKEVARQECLESEKYQGDRGAMVIPPKKKGRPAPAISR